jgi:negative regulator of flagellin synthesis FlgM
LKIQPSISGNPLTGGVASARTEAVAGYARSSGATGSGSSAVDLSAAARHLASLQDASGDIDTSRVEQLKSALASGQLKMDPSRIAEGLLASVRDLLK